MTKSAGFIKTPCGMVLGREAAVAEYVFAGKLYCFCADLCCETFKVNPKKFLCRMAGRRNEPRFCR